MIQQTSAAFAKHCAQSTRLKLKKMTRGKEEETTLHLYSAKKRKHTLQTILLQSRSRNVNAQKHQRKNMSHHQVQKTLKY